MGYEVNSLHLAVCQSHRITIFRSDRLFKGLVHHLILIGLELLSAFRDKIQLYLYTLITFMQSRVVSQQRC